MSTSMQQREIPREVNGHSSAGKLHLFPDRQISTQSQMSAVPSPSCFQTLFSWRAYMVLQLHLSLLLIFTLLQNMPFALVCMIRSPAHNASIHDDRNGSARMSSANGSFEDAQSLEWNNSSSDAGYQGERSGEFDWDSSTKGLLLSGVSMLAFITPLMTDFFSRRVGAKTLIFWTLFLAAGITLLQPVGTRVSPYVLVALRMLLGLIGGMKMPLMNELFSWWAPEREKVTMLSFAYSGSNTASIVVSLTSGYLCSVPVDNGWPFIFYVHGALAMCWCFLWQFTGSIKPEDHPYISEDEKQYIIQTRRGMEKMQKHSKPPYREILTSVPVWGYLTIIAVHTYSILVIMAFIPVYFNTALGFSVEKVGVIASVTYVVRLVGVLGWGQMSNLLLRKTRLSVTACRKIIQCSGYYGSGTGLVALAFVRDELWAICLVCGVLVMQSSAITSGVIVPLDMAPRYAGFLTGFSVTVCSIFAIPGPLLTSYVVGNGTIEEWRNVFIGLGVIAFVGATCFLIMGSSELQSWAKPGGMKDKSQKESSDGKERRVSVMSLGTPGSPSKKQRRFEFSFIVEGPNFTDARLERNGSHLAVPSSALDPSNETVSTISENIPMTLVNNHRSSLRPGGDETIATTTNSHGKDLVSSVTHRTERSSGRGSGTVQEHHHSHVSGNGRNGAFTNLGFDGRPESKE